MSTTDTTPADLIGRTIHLTRGQKYHGAVRVTGIAADFGDRGLHLKGQSPSEAPEITGAWLPECVITVLTDDIHATETDARTTIKARRSAAKARRAETAPQMMPATDGNMLAMLVGATKMRAR